MVDVILIQPPIHESIKTKYVSTQIPINLGYIAASLEQKGAKVKIIDFCVEKFDRDKFLKTLYKYNPRIIAFTSFTPSINYVGKIAKIVKEFNNKITTVLGGIHVSAIPELTLKELPFIDIGVIGEGEETIKEIYDNVSKNKIKGIAYRNKNKIKINPRRPLINNLDDIPFPARHLFKIDRYNKTHVSRGFSRKYLRIMEIITSRGCPNRCIFCAGHINYGQVVRYRSYENIVSEIEMLIKRYKINHITIEDDTFTINKKLVKKLCRYFKERNLGWDCNGRVDTVDFELLKLMKNSGCKKISFGIESGSPRILGLIKKNTNLNQIRNAFKWTKKAGIRYVEGTFILGSHPDETLEDIKETKKLMFELLPDFVALTVISPFPGTEVYDIMLKNKQLNKNPNWARFTFINNNPPFEHLNNLSAKQLVKFQKKILQKYYSSPRYILKQIIQIRTLNEMLYFMNLFISFLIFIFKKPKVKFTTKTI